VAEDKAQTVEHEKANGSEPTLQGEGEKIEGHHIHQQVADVGVHEAAHIQRVVLAFP
jgi:hypothetical protein